MHPRFDSYRETELAKAIVSLAYKPERLVEFVLLSRLKMPAIIALSWDVEPLLKKLSNEELRTAKQFCGAVVGDIMRENRYEIINPRGSAKAGGVFTLGAVWGSLETAHEHAMEIARQAMKEYEDTLRTLAKS